MQCVIQLHTYYQPPKMSIEIYITTGKIIDLLHKEEKVEFSRLCVSLDQPRDTILMSLGWLVRQGYVILEQDQENISYSLRKDNGQAAKKIKCPHCRLGRQNLCLAHPYSLMIPSVYELENFCLSGNYENCPLQIKVNC